MEDKKLNLAVTLITKNPEYIPIMKEKYLSDDVLAMCLEDEPSLFKFIPNPSLRIIKLALQLDGGNIKYIKKKIRKQLPSDYLVMAVDSNPRSRVTSGK